MLPDLKIIYAKPAQKRTQNCSKGAEHKTGLKIS